VRSGAYELGGKWSIARIGVGFFKGGEGLGPVKGVCGEALEREGGGGVPV
jgi:hypothetical protein